MKINSLISEESERKLLLEKSHLISDALKQMKPKKRDALYDTVSDMYLNGPQELSEHLALLIRSFLRHGQIPEVLISCVLRPLVKNKFDDITESTNYRAIAGGCLILKLIDQIFLILEGSKLNFDQLQFAYQKNNSTTMCSWMVTSVIEHYLNDGSRVFGASMDMSKAFDMVDWNFLFSDLLKRRVDPMFLRLMIYIYEHQKCSVKWGESNSSSFGVKNGVRQGGVSSAVLFGVYINDLIVELRSSKLGCTIFGEYCGVFVFADDLFLLSASRNGLQCMVNLCNKFVQRRNLKFWTNRNPLKSKTKCIVFDKKIRCEPLKIKLNGDLLPWVHEVTHLGCTLESDNKMKKDMIIKRCIFNNRVNSLLQEFNTSSPAVLMKCVGSYTTSFVGSQIWDLNSDGCNKLYRSWNVLIRNVYRLDRRTHRCLIEPISKALHLKTSLCSRFLKFALKILDSDKFIVRFLGKLTVEDLRTTFGRNMRNISNACNVSQDKLSPAIVKTHMKYFDAQFEDKWKISICDELFGVKNNETVLEGLTSEEIEYMFHYVCIN